MELHEFPVFENLEKAQVADFCAACDRTQHVAGEELITSGDRGGTFFFLLEGEVEVYLPETRGRHVLCTISAPAVLGEMEFLTGKPRTASVCTLSDVTLLESRSRRSAAAWPTATQAPCSSSWSCPRFWRGA
jgi:CRP-like cAMP-binding protein